jgi:UDP-N-acetyl-D-galactosamine dehydrogenase
VGIFGLTFKENVPDLRNSRVPDIKSELEEYGITVLVHDPLADPDEAMLEYGVSLSPLEAMHGLDAAVFAVAHGAYDGLGLDALSERFRREDRAVLLDLKGIWKRPDAEKAGFAYWRL